MAIFTEPRDVSATETAKVFSDASDNIAAIKEIDAWAREHGFVRTREQHLHVVNRDNQILYWGVCWRPTEEDRRQADADIRRWAERRERMPLTASSDLLLREDG